MNQTSQQCVLTLQAHAFIVLQVHIKGRASDSWWTFIHKDLPALQVELKWYKLAHNRQA